jgi:hypothetical protein
MSDHGTSSELGPMTAIVSLVSLVFSFFDNVHVWLHNLTLVVSLIAGLIAIYAGIKRLKQ